MAQNQTVVIKMMLFGRKLRHQYPEARHQYPEAAQAAFHVYYRAALDEYQRRFETP